MFLADKDVSDGIYTHCFRQDEVVDTAKLIYYGVKILKDLRARVP